MTATGIGAPVRRKEDQRFVTGQGRYVDDFNRPGQAHAYFLRSPHAHAAIRSIDTGAARAMPGVVGIFTGDDLAADKVGGLICGWMIHSKDGSPMKAGPASGAGAGQGALCRRPRRGRDRRDPGAGEGRRRGDRGRLRGPAGGRRYRAARSRAATAVHEVAPDNTVFNWHLGDKDAVEQAFAQAKHVTKIDLVNNRLVPNPMEPRAALGEYDPGNDAYTLYTTSQNPHVARLVLSAFIGIAPEHKLRVIAPDVGGGFGSKIFIYAEETVCVWAAKKVKRPVKWTSRPHRGLPLATRTGATTSPMPRWRSTTTARSSASGSTRSPISAPISRPSRPRCRPTSTRRCCPASTTSRRSIARSTRSTPTPRRSTPIAAPAGRRRPSCVERIVEKAARELGQDPANFRKRNYIKKFPHQTPVIMTYDAGDYAASLDKALEIADYKNFGQAQARERPQRQAARHRLLELHRGLRHRALAGGRLARRRRRPVGIRRGAGQPDGLGRGAHRLAQPRPGPRDHLRPARLRPARHPDRPGHDRPRRHRQGAVRHGHLRLALRARSACRRSPRRSTR